MAFECKDCGSKDIICKLDRIGPVECLGTEAIAYSTFKIYCKRCKGSNIVLYSINLTISLDKDLEELK